MNTRAGLYANEAVKLLDTVSAYTTLYTQQVLRLFPAGKADTIRTLLRRFAKERRLYLSKDETVGFRQSEISIERRAHPRFLGAARFHRQGGIPRPRRISRAYQLFRW